MSDPSIPKELGRENRYMLASIIGKRAVQLNMGSSMLVKCDSGSNVKVAICEYKADKLTYVNRDNR